MYRSNPVLMSDTDESEEDESASLYQKGKTYVLVTALAKVISLEYQDIHYHTRVGNFRICPLYKPLEKLIVKTGSRQIGLSTEP